ncbi:MAG: glycosyltransferase family 2 protein [bacterium]
MEKISFVIPVYNSEKSIALTVSEIKKVMNNSLTDYRHEIILINDGSRDNSDSVCRELVEKYKNMKYICLARNFGQHNAVLAGFNAADGDYLISMDDDLQLMPEDTELLLRKMKTDNLDVVYGNYRSKKHGVFRNLSTRINQKMGEILLDKPEDIQLTSFYIVRKYVADEIRQYRGPFPYMGGLVLRTTGKIGSVEVRHRERKYGSSNYTLKKLFGLWLNGFTNFSVKPLRFIAFTGVVSFVVSMIFMVFLLVKKWINPDIPVGWTSIILSVFAFGSLQLAATGFVGEYVGRVFMNINRNPQYVVRDFMVSGVDDEQKK